MGGGEDEDNNKPLARTLMQYEEADNAGFGGFKQESSSANKKWLIAAQVIDVNGSKVLIAVDSQMSVLLYDVL